MSGLVLEDFNISPFANGSVIQTADKVDRKKNMMNNHGEKVDNFMHGIREHGNYFDPLLLHVPKT